MSLLEAKHVTVRFASRDAVGGHKLLTAVADVSLSLERGERLGVVGESGSGKTTLGRALLAIEKMAGGTVAFLGRDVHAMRGETLKGFRRSAQMVFQDPMGSLNPRMKIGAALGEVLAVHKVVPKTHRAERVAELLEQVGLNPAYASRYPHEFSGGQRQRIGLARALALNPVLMVADEPVSALDVSVQAQILNLIKDICEQRHMACILIAHDLAVVHYVCQKTMVMYQGRVVESGLSSDVLGNPLHPYTKALKAAVPEPEEMGVRGAERDTERAAQAIRVEGGCAYASRCPQACEPCQRSVPALLQSERAGQYVACHLVKTNTPEW